MHSTNNAYSSNHKIQLKEVYDNLRNKEFSEAIIKLKLLSEKNVTIAQSLYSKVLYVGNITTQDFEISYFWANIARLGGEKENENLLGKLDNLISKDNKIKINEKIKNFLSKLAVSGNKLAIIQLAKCNLELSEEPNYEDAYKWFNIAVALGIKSAKNKRDEMINNIETQKLFEIQKESNKIFNKIKNLGD
ncbi:MAG: sel1 repeat family protein [Alphaproteobacteria bacterium TMED54]|nr:MAG: sel1 repeat family protein [Alphaproteobacteria bacterium TMED54]